MRRQVLISLGLVVALLAAGGGGALLLIHFAPTPQTTGPARPTLLVRGLVLEPRTVVEPIIGYGTARADRYAWITAEVSGEIVELKPDLRVGAPVGAGELLVRIDEREYRRKLERARSLLAAEQARLETFDIEVRNLERLIESAAVEVEIAEREYERIVGLFEAGQAPRREVDLARQAYERARRTLQNLENSKALLPQQRAAQQATCELRQAEVGLAELELERCRICAPFGGRIAVVEVELGERVVVGQQLVALLDPNLIEVPIELPVSQRDRVVRGAECRLALESNPGMTWTGEVARIAPSADQNTRTFAAFVEVDNTRQDSPLMPGQFVRAVIAGPTWRDVLVVPRGAIQRGEVYVCADGVARRRPVEVERYLLDEAVVSGLKAGEVVITSNLDALFDGAPVRVERRAPRVAGGREELPGAAEQSTETHGSPEAPTSGRPQQGTANGS